VQQAITCDEVLKSLASFILKFDTGEAKTLPIINKVVKVFRYLAKEPTLIMHFEDLGLISNCMRLLKKALDECFNSIKSSS
jgi:hypothetical protein